MLKSISARLCDSNPSPEQIAEECRRIRARWNARERERRAARGLVHLHLICGLIVH
jgi:hypothetical protein